MSDYRLQLQGRWTDSVDELVAECEVIRVGLEKHGLTVIGYDPGALVREAENPNSNAFDLPTWFIKRLLSAPPAAPPAQALRMPESAILHRMKYHWHAADPTLPDDVDDWELYPPEVDCAECIDVLIVRADAIGAAPPAVRMPLNEEQLEQAYRTIWRENDGSPPITAYGWIAAGIRYAEQAHRIGAAVAEPLTDAARYRFLVQQAPETVAAIAYRFPQACAHSDPTAAVDAAMAAHGGKP